MSGIKGRGGGQAPLPVNKVLLIPKDAQWDWDSLRVVFRQIRLHQRIQAGDMAKRLDITRGRLNLLEKDAKDWHTSRPPDWFLKLWAQRLGYTLHIGMQRSDCECVFRLEKGAYSRRG